MEPGSACPPPDGSAPNSDDCDDGEPAVNPAARERCNGADDNCDGSTDEGLPLLDLFADVDSDGYGDPSMSVVSCMAMPGFVTDGSDCDDGNRAVHPGAAELCNGADDDCDTIADGPTTTTWGPFSSPPNGPGYTTVNFGNFENTNWDNATNGWASPWPNGHFDRVCSPGMGAENNCWAQTVTTENGSNAGYATTTQHTYAAGTYVLSGFFDTAGIPGGNLRVDLPEAPGTVWIFGAPNEQRGWQFVSTTFTLTASTALTIRLVRDGDRSTSDVGRIDYVGITPAASYVAPTRACGPAGGTRGN